MKKLIALIMALVMCLSLVACSGGQTEESTEPETTAPPETISMESLFASLDNGARAQLNVGKATVVYGKVISISSTYCSILAFFKDRFPNDSMMLQIEMTSEVLVGLYQGQFVAIPALISAYDDSNDFTLTATEIADIEMVDTYIRSLFNNLDYSKIHEIALEYVESRGTEFMLTDDAELQQYLIGEWKQRNGDGEEMEFKANGEYLWKYSEKAVTGAFAGNWVQRTQRGDWSVSEGKLDSFIGGTPQIVYVLSEDFFMCQDSLYERQK